MSNIYAVAGNPVFQSRSPRMFNAAFREFALDAVYTRLAASTAGEVIATARDVGIDGLNITSPFKADVIPSLDAVEADAGKIGAVNTVVRRAGRFVGYNTDVAGVLGALRKAGLNKQGKRRLSLAQGAQAGRLLLPSFLREPTS